MLASSLEHVEGPLDVCVNIGIRGMIGKWNADQRCQMEHDLAAFHGGFDAIGISNVAGKNFNTIQSFPGQGIEPAP